MARPSDTEYKLRYQIKELKDQLEKLETENARLRKQLDKLQVKDEEPKKGKIKPKHIGGCPSCDAPIKITELPFGKLKICTAACGWRKVDHG